MRKILMLPVLMMATGAWAADIDTALNDARTACAGISSDMEHLKKMAGISTAAAGVGAVGGGVAMVAGDKKASQDKTKAQVAEISSDDVDDALKYAKTSAGEQEIKNAEDNLKKKSNGMNWGALRTGGLAVGAAGNATSAIISGTNRVKADLQDRIQACRDAVNVLGAAYMQARIENPTDVRVAQADNIINACSKWEYVDLDKINKKATGAMISGTIGAGVGFAGTIASVMANDKKSPAKNADGTANVMATGAMIAGLGTAGFSMGQIKAIKNAVSVADQCEEALQK